MFVVLRRICASAFRSALRSLRVGMPALVVAFCLPTLAAGQSVGAIRVRGEVFAGSEVEDYLRVLQTAGLSGPYPWSIRAFSPREVDRLLPTDSLHPWAEYYALHPDTAVGLRFDWIRPQARTVYNSAFPFGANDGPVWAGRGITASLQLGFAARYGPVSLTVAPVAFLAQNADFDLLPNGYTGPQAFADGRFPGAIDLPQRFGEGRYARIDPGASTLRLDLAGVAVGASTANQQWGPAREHPILLGTNAPGFPHAFLGTSTPWNVGLGRLHGRLVWGELSQSPYSTVQGPDERRFMSGLVAVFTPRWIPGLELGGARFFHSSWPEGGLTGDDLLRPLEGLFKGGLRDEDVLPGDPKSDFRNQLASVFARWVFPVSGVEVYGEYGREDHSWDLRDFTLEPDHSGGYLLGFQKVWRTPGAELWGFRGEVLDLQVSHISRVRYQGPFYTHFAARQGHTHRGQLLGSAAGYGGAGSVLSVDRYHERGRWTVAWTRALRQERGDSVGTAVTDRRGLDVVHTLGAETLWFLDRFEVSAELTGVYNLNRDFEQDVFNLRAALGVRLRP